MTPAPLNPAAIDIRSPQRLYLSGFWTAFGVGPVVDHIDAWREPVQAIAVVDAAQIEALDTAGAWILQAFLARLRRDSRVITLEGLAPKFARLLEAVVRQSAESAEQPLPPDAAMPEPLERLGRGVCTRAQQGLALLAFVGETATALAGTVALQRRWRWRAVLFNIRSAGVDALPIVGLLSLLLGIVVAYQGADPLRQYGANIFVADLVGLSMLREFAPLITAIVIAGRSGSAYAAQIGTMAVTEEIDAMRTLGIAPQELLVLPKLIALVITMPLLTVFADVLGVFGGMLMAEAQLEVSFVEFLDRFVKAVSPTAFLIGVCKAPVFAAIIVIVGCYQGFCTRGGADSVGRQTTRAVVQSIFLVIVADALFSVAFSALGL